MLKDIDITAEDLVNRLVLLPPPLRTAAESEENAKAIEAICREQGVTDEGKIVAAQQAFCFSLLGLVKPEDIGKEIDALLDLKDPARAEKIAVAGRAKVFMGLEAEIAKNYHPEILRIPDEPSIASAPSAPSTTAVPAPKSPLAQQPSVTTPSAATPPPAPVVIRREASIAPVKPIADQGSRIPMSDLLARTVPTPAPKSAEARLEIGKMMPERSMPAGPAVVARTEAPAPRVVNYAAPAPAPENRNAAVSLGDVTRRPAAPMAPAPVPSMTIKPAISSSPVPPPPPAAPRAMTGEPAAPVPPPAPPRKL